MKKHLFSVISIIFSLALFAGCADLTANQVDEEPPPLPPPALGIYLDFEDVQIPPGMELDRKTSFVYQSDNIKAGVLSLNGREKPGAVLNFFQDQMPKDGWSMLSSFKYHKNVLIYTKANKVCLIVAENPSGLSALRVEVWVAPLKPGSQLGSTPSTLGGILPGDNRSGPTEENLLN